jgi:hypothetical protein
MKIENVRLEEGLAEKCGCTAPQLLQKRHRQLTFFTASSILIESLNVDKFICSCESRDISHVKKLRGCLDPPSMYLNHFLSLIK